MWMGDVIKTKSIDIQAGSLLSNKKVKLDKKDEKVKKNWQMDYMQY